jgi:predicted nucleic acid-binding protein
MEVNPDWVPCIPQPAEQPGSGILQNMTTEPPYMLDTSVFNKLIDQKISPSPFAGRRVLSTGIQVGELRATLNEKRKTTLLDVFTEVAPVPTFASSFAFGVEGAGFGQALWNDGTEQVEKMLARLETLDGKKRKNVNQTKDVLIAETAIKNGVILISDNCNLRQLMSEFGGRAISLEEFLSSTGMTINPPDTGSPA